MQFRVIFLCVFFTVIVSCISVSGRSQEWEPVGGESFESITGVDEGSLLLIRYPGDILRSSDSGGTWSVVCQAGFRVSGIDYASRKLSSEGERSCIVAYSDSSNAIVSYDSGRDWKETDGSESFQKFTSNAPPHPWRTNGVPSPLLLRFASQEGEHINSYAKIDSKYWAVGEPGLIEVWDSISKQWRELRRAPYPHPMPLPRGEGASIDFATPALGAIARGSEIYFTYDSGVTWERTVLPDSGIVSTLFFIDDTCTLVGTESGKLYSYSRYDPVWMLDTQVRNVHPILQIGWQDVYAQQLFVLTDSELYTVSADLQIATSSPVPLRTGERAVHVSFPNSYVGFLLADSTTRHDTLTAEGNDTTLYFDTSTIYRSLDGGGTWSMVLKNIAGITSVCFPSVRIGYACGGNGRLLITYDSGSHWTQVRTGTKQTLRCIRFVNDSVGYAAGDSGTVLFTYNFGKSWRALPPEPFFFHPSESYSAIAFRTPQEVWIAGSNKGFRAPIKIPSGWRYGRHAARRASLTVSAYPDPAIGPITFDIKLSGAPPSYGALPELKICDVSGKAVYEVGSVHEVSTSEWQAEADLSFLQQGVYTAIASYSGQTGVGKFYLSR